MGVVGLIQQGFAALRGSLSRSPVEQEGSVTERRLSGFAPETSEGPFLPHSFYAA